MVTIQPFEYEKTTAFKERVQIANKVNEIINLFNELDIESKINVFNEEIVIINGKITEINNALNEVNTAVNTVEGYNTRLTSVENESISLDARLDNLENKDLENVKLSGNQTIEGIKTYTKSPIVPNPPSGDTSTKAVNTNWISQTGDNSPNNLIHKTGNEVKRGKLTFETNRPEGVSHQYQTNSNTDEYIKRIIQRIVTPDGNVTVKYLVIYSRVDNYGIASVKYDNGILNLTYTAISGTLVPTFRIFQKDGITYIGMDMPYHTGITLEQLTYADNYGNNIFYSPLIDEYSNDYIEVAHT